MTCFSHIHNNLSDWLFFLEIPGIQSTPAIFTARIKSIAQNINKQSSHKIHRMHRSRLVMVEIVPSA